MTRVAVVGATGYAGAELVRLLAGHPHVELSLLTSRQYAGEPYDRIYPAMNGVVDLVCQPYDENRVDRDADLVFTALPHKLPMKLVPGLIRRGKRVIDLSADFRFANADAYESVYQAHTARDLLNQAVYGLSEIYADAIAGARLVGNPGCYPTSVLLPLIPLLKNGLIPAHSIIADAKSGVSGAGRSPSLTTHFCEVNESHKAYKVAEHRHNPEMEEILNDHVAAPLKITFVPHLVPMTRGMLTTLYVPLKDRVDTGDIGRWYASFYGSHRFIRLRPPDSFPDTLHVRGTNYCDIGFRLDDRRNCLILISAIDNLVKGAAGQAVQNMNIMLGLEETAGLLNVPYPV